MEGGEALTTGGPVLRVVSLGGLPPPTHEELRLTSDGTAWYVAGLPWPAQPPFDEIGIYRTEVGGAVFERLAGAARPVLTGASTPTGAADLGIEGVALDDTAAYWSPDARPPGAVVLLREARAVVGVVRASPWAVVAGRVDGGTTLVLAHRGDHPLAVRGGEVRAGWAAPGEPPSPLVLAARPPVAVALPPSLGAGTRMMFALPDPGVAAAEGDEVYALARLDFRSPHDETWIEGWLVAGPGQHRPRSS